VTATPTISPAARVRERSIAPALGTDLILIVAIAAAAIVANSLTMLAETLRATLLAILEGVLLLLMRRIHRGRVRRFDSGTAKLEPFANLGIGTAMGLAGLVVGAEALAGWLDPAPHEHAGLAFVVAVGAANPIQNGLALLALRRAGRDGTSIIMRGQIRSRLTKTLSSGLVLVSLVVGAIEGDTPAGHLAEFLGSAFVAFVMLELAVTM
jgi:divalent metal cation (Fe/Co/Zn/Cd) transporter